MESASSIRARRLSARVVRLAASLEAWRQVTDPIGRERPQPDRARDLAWLVAALAFTLLFAGRTLAPAFGPGDEIQDDLRQWAVWLIRLRDPELLRNDLIADYYQAVAPPGYSALFWLLSRVIDPLRASKLLPFVLGAVTTIFTFLLVRRLHPSREGAFLASVLVSWHAWQYDDLASATPRAFALPLLAAVLWGQMTGRAAIAGGLVVLAALFYPIAGLVSLGLLSVRLVHLKDWRPSLTRVPAAWLTFLTALFLTLALLLPGQLASSRFGPVVSAAEAQALPDFLPNGRFPLFGSDAYHYWVMSGEGGLGQWIPDALLPGVPIFLELAVLALPLPALLLLRRRDPEMRLLGSSGRILVDLPVASFLLFFLAHLLLYRLYSPSRYVKWSLQLVIPVAAGIALGILVAGLATRLRAGPGRVLTGGLALGLGVALAAYPARYEGFFVRDGHPTITAYLRTQPKNTLVAGAPADVDSIPAFAGRSVLASREHALPFHLGYYGEMRQRLEALIEAYYAESPTQVADFTARYDVDVLLVNRAAFRQETFEWIWARPWQPFVSIVSHRLDGTKRFALLDLAESCAAVDDGQVALIPSACLDRRR